MEPKIDDGLNLSVNSFFSGSPIPCAKNCLVQADSAQLRDRNVMIGLGFGKSGVPIDILTLLLAAKESSSLLVVVVDEFAVMNGLPKKEVDIQTAKLLDAIGRLTAIYRLPIISLKCSSFMNSSEYQTCFEEVKDLVAQMGLEQNLLESVPPRYRTNLAALQYPLHEIAVTLHLKRRMGLQVKLGPSKERVYDLIMRAMELPIDFAYAIDALPLCTKHPTPVIHYIPDHLAKGQRVMLSDSAQQVAERMAQSHESTLRYFVQLASTAGRCLWRPILH